MNKLRSFLRAVFSFFAAGDAPLGLYFERQALCIGSEFAPKCNEAKGTETGLFCAACGCPPSPISDLRTKWRMVDAACPLGKW